MSMVGTLERAGFASLDDLESPEWRTAFRHLEEVHAAFAARSAEFRSPEYHWPHEALHDWSRVWEYPWAWHQLAPLIAAGPVRVLDFGSGVTFFPFALARRGAAVTCVDIDPIAGRDLAGAVHAFPPTPGSVAFVRTDGTSVSLPDGSFDAAYCISVLEHVPDPAALVGELARVLEPGGLFVLSIDLAMAGSSLAIQPEPWARLLDALKEHFDEVYPPSPVHPLRTLTTRRSPYPLRSSNVVKDLSRRLVNAVLRETFGHERAVELCCQGFVMRRRR